jgi:transcriptional regulator with XRE-family HTH domain/tetratricopeptide (TPR) repeat protein
LFGRQVVMLRRERGLTQEELAARTGLSVRSIRDVEAGRVSRPRISTVRLLADAFGLTGAERAEFLGAADTPAARGPRQLPLDIAGFAGREAELARLDRAIREAGDRPATVVLSAVAGMAGVGKTALALHWAHRVRDEYPDGQLYVNLRGFDAAESVVDPADALRGFLNALDVPPGRIPAGLDERAALFRTVAGDKRLLLVLDNARDEEQVRPLLPGAGGCAVVVTSRDRLTGLVAAQSAQPVRLDVLAGDEAWALLADRIGADRLTAEPAAAAQIISATGRLPLALTIVAARIATHPDFPLSTFAAELRAPHGTLDALDDGDLRRVFSWSYLACRKEARRLFRLLGVHPGPDLTAGVAAALADVPPAGARPLLGELTRLHLIAEHRPGRYVFHDLLRAYAEELALHYLQCSYAAGVLVQPQWAKVPMPEPLTRVADAPQTHEAALAYFAAEERVLPTVVRAAADHGADAYAWRLAWCLACYFAPSGRWQDSAPVQRVALAAAERAGDRLGEATALRLLSRAEGRIGMLAEADDKMRRSRDIYAGLGDASGEAQAEHNLSELSMMRGDLARGRAHAERAVELYRRAGNRDGEARALNAIGWLAANMGDYDVTIARCSEALAVQEVSGDRNGQAATLDSLAVAYQALGDLPRAAEMYQRSSDLFRESADRFHTAEVLVRLGEARDVLGDPAAARAAWQEALTVYLEIGDESAADVLARLDALDQRGSGR